MIGLLRQPRPLPPKQLVKDVERGEKHCSWCRYPIVQYSPVYRLAVGGVPLGPIFCDARCGEIEALVRKRGPVIVVYQGESHGAKEHRSG